MDVAYELRPGLHWSDGQPINADDVIFTWQVTPRTEGYDQISGVDKTGDLAFTIHFKAVYPAFGLLFPAILPKHRLAGVDRARLDTDAYWSAPSVVSGPFMVAESVPADHITLQRNPRYGDGRAEQPLLNHSPYLEKLLFKAFATKSALLSALKAGDVHVALQLDESDRAAGARLQWVPALSYEQVTFNQQSAVWKDDPQLLTALTEAVDVDGVIAGPLQKRAPAAVGPISPQLDWAYNGDLAPPRRHLGWLVVLASAVVGFLVVALLVTGRSPRGTRPVQVGTAPEIDEPARRPQPSLPTPDEPPPAPGENRASIHPAEARRSEDEATAPPAQEKARLTKPTKRSPRLRPNKGSTGHVDYTDDGSPILQ